MNLTKMAEQRERERDREREREREKEREQELISFINIIEALKLISCLDSFQHAASRD